MTHLLVDIGRIENRLQVDPLLLGVEPLFKNFRHERQLLIPVANALLERALESRELPGGEKQRAETTEIKGSV